MERIQSAIEKARKARQDGANDLKVRPATAQEQAKSDASVDSNPPVKAARTDPASDAFWNGVTPFHPKSARLRRSRILAYQACHEAAPYDMMRTKLMQQMRKNDWRRLAMTSAAPGSGKTMTCLNLAFSLARQNDLKIMVIELDMRRPSMAKALGMQEPLQFSEALAGRDVAERHMVRYGSNLVFALSQNSTRHSAELLQGTIAAGVLDSIEANYKPDIMIFDLPPLMASDDTMAFLDQIDCAMLLVEAGKTRPDHVDKCEQDLAARTNILGVVLNKCRFLDRSENYGYYYGD